MKEKKRRKGNEYNRQERGIEQKVWETLEDGGEIVVQIQKKRKLMSEFFFRRRRELCSLNETFVCLFLAVELVCDSISYWHHSMLKQERARKSEQRNTMTYRKAKLFELPSERMEQRRNSKRIEFQSKWWSHRWSWWFRSFEIEDEWFVEYRVQHRFQLLQGWNRHSNQGKNHAKERKKKRIELSWSAEKRWAWQWK